MSAVGMGSSLYNFPVMMARTPSNGLAPVRVLSPMGQVAIVYTDITSAASLWEHNAEAMKDATLLHNQLLRSLLSKHHGYEVCTRERVVGEGSFCFIFQEAISAVEFCLEAQKALLEVDWPEAILKHPGAMQEWGNTDNRWVSPSMQDISIAIVTNANERTNKQQSAIQGTSCENGTALW